MKHRFSATAYASFLLMAALLACAPFADAEENLPAPEVTIHPLGHGERIERGGAAALLRIAHRAPDVTLHADLLSDNPGAAGDIRSLGDKAEATYEIVPGEGAEALRVSVPLDALLLPSRHVESVLFDTAEHTGTLLNLPDDNLLIGLAGGGDIVVVVGWPAGERRVQAQLDGRGGSSITVGFGGQPVYVRIIREPGIWHRFAPKPEHQETVFPIEWKPPFKARYQTQAMEADVPTTYTIRNSDGRSFRPGIGMLLPPARYGDDGTVLMRWAGNLPLMTPTWFYALEGHDRTPYITLRDALTPEQQRHIPELQKTDPYQINYRTGVPGVWHAACGGRDRIRDTTLRAGSQQRIAGFIASYSVDRFGVAKMAEIQHRRYEEFMDRMEGRFDQWIDQAGDDDVAAYLRHLAEALPTLRELHHQRLGGETADQKIAAARILQDRFAELATEDGEEVYPEIIWALNQLNASLSRYENLGRRFGTVTRELFRQAAIQAADHPGKIPYAEAIRHEIRELMKIRQWEFASGRPGSLVRNR